MRQHCLHSTNSGYDLCYNVAVKYVYFWPLAWQLPAIRVTLSFPFLPYMLLADRVSRIEEPQTIKMAKLSRALSAEGKDVVDLSLGEPDFPTPEHIIAAANTAMRDGYTKYPPVAGYPELKAAIARKFARDNQLNYTPDQIMVCTGAKQCIANVMMCLINHGDEVIIPSPYWVTYGDLVHLCGGSVLELQGSLQNNYKITPEALEAAIKPHTKAFIFSSPCNPSGSIYTESELIALAEVFDRHPQVTVISDEIYEYINFVGKHHSIAHYGNMYERTVVVNGLSKSYSMTGWRLGYMAGPAAIIKSCETMQSQFTSGPNSITQRAAITALDGSKDSVDGMVVKFKQRRDYLVTALKEIPHLQVNDPAGAFYVFPNISWYFGKSYKEYTINNSLDLCLFLLKEGLVTCVAGSAFGNDECMRLSYATNTNKLESAVERIRTTLAKLQ
jgi:aspartate aminotransferase